MLNNKFSRKIQPTLNERNLSVLKQRNHNNAYRNRIFTFILDLCTSAFYHKKKLKLKNA